MTETDSTTDSIEFTPTVRPLLLKWGVVAAISIAAVAFLVFRGSGGFPTVMLSLLALLLLLFTVRTIIQSYVLLRTQYEVSPDVVRSSYDVLFKYSEHEVPTERVRGIRVRQSRFERLFGLGSLELVTSGENVGVSRLRIQHVANPKSKKTELADRVREATTDKRAAMPASA